MAGPFLLAPTEVGCRSNRGWNPPAPVPSPAVVAIVVVVGVIVVVVVGVALLTAGVGMGGGVIGGADEGVRVVIVVVGVVIEVEVEVAVVAVVDFSSEATSLSADVPYLGVLIFLSGMMSDSLSSKSTLLRFFIFSTNCAYSFI